MVIQTAIMVGYILWETLSYNSEQMRGQLNETDKVTIDLLSDLARISLFSLEYDSLQSHVSRISEDPRVKVIYVETDKHVILASNQLDMMGELLPNLINSATEYWIIRTIGTHGAVHIQFSTERQQEIARQTKSIGLKLGVFGIIIIAIVGITLGHVLTFRLMTLANLLREYNLENEDITIDKKLLKSKDEVGELARTFENMHLHIIEYINKIHEETEERINAQTANKVKSDFMANMSHELRTPLNAIIGYSELIVESDIPENSVITEDVIKIQTSGKHLLKLINDILDLSKIEAGKVDISYTKVNFKNLLIDVSKSIYPQFLKNNNKLEMNIDPDIGHGYFDETKLKQILLNLLSNACKFTQSGLITISSFSVIIKNVPYYVVEVHDSGIGMTKEQCNKVFDAYKQADSSTTRKYGGTGLGLTISKNYCEMMGGRISVNSELGKGSTFSITIPTQNDIVNNTALKKVV